MPARQAADAADEACVRGAALGKNRIGRRPAHDFIAAATGGASAGGCRRRRIADPGRRRRIARTACAAASGPVRLPSGLEACAQIRADAERLACYDRYVAPKVRGAGEVSSAGSGASAPVASAAADAAKKPVALPDKGQYLDEFWSSRPSASAASSISTATGRATSCRCTGSAPRTARRPRRHPGTAASFRNIATSRPSCRFRCGPSSPRGCCCRTPTCGSPTPSSRSGSSTAPTSPGRSVPPITSPS